MALWFGICLIRKVPGRSMVLKRVAFLFGLWKPNKSFDMVINGAHLFRYLD